MSMLIIGCCNWWQSINSKIIYQPAFNCSWLNVLSICRPRYSFLLLTIHLCVWPFNTNRDYFGLWYKLVSSVRSSNSHPDLLLTQQHQPLFQITPVLNTGLSLSGPLQLYQRPGMDAPPRREPSPRGRGGFPAPPRAVGMGGFPAPPRPAPPRKNEQNRGEVAGQNKGPNLNFLQ